MCTAHGSVTLKFGPAEEISLGRIFMIGKPGRGERKMPETIILSKLDESDRNVCPELEFMESKTAS
jgi:hypothetical protein